ncbi:MAG: hypothetical protein RL021_298 [Bacteroidota bacterium]
MLRPLFFLIIAVTFFKDSPAADPELIFASRINKDSLRSYLSVLTSDSLQGRETGKPGQKKAARYLVDSFTEFGLTPLAEGGMQFHGLSARANKQKNIVIGDMKYVYWNDFFAFTSGNDSGLTVDHLICLNHRRLFTSGTARKLSKLIDTGSGLLITGLSDSGTQSYTPDHILKELQEQMAPIINMAHLPRVVFLEHTDFNEWVRSVYIKEHKDDSIRSFLLGLPFRIVVVSKSMVESSFHSRSGNKIRKYKTEIQVPSILRQEELMGENIPFVVIGSEKPDEYVSVTAHYDHLGVRGDTVYYGADDDASGTSVVIELARIFSLAAANGAAPLRSILFMPVSGEEKGLLGSRYYSENPLVPLNQTVAEVNIDMIGRIDHEHDSLGNKDYIYVIGSDKLSSELHAINEQANREHVGLLLDYRYNVPGEPNRFYFRSDHYNFAKHGVPSIFYFNGKHVDYHKPSDTMDKIDLEVMEKRTRLIFHTVWELANRPERIVVDRKNDMERTTKEKR